MIHVPREEGGNWSYVKAAINNNFTELDGRTTEIDGRVTTLESATSPVIPSGRKNYLINGNFDIWQRGTSQTGNAYLSVDRWAIYSSGTTKSVSRQSFTLGQTAVPNNPKYYIRYTTTTVAGVGNYALLRQLIEDVIPLSGRTATLSFWAKADAAKNISTSIRQAFGTGGSPSADVIVHADKFALSTAWQKFTITISIPSISGKTIGSDLNSSLWLNFYFDAGSNFNTETDTLGQQSGTFDIAQVQLEEGSVATDFERRTYADELQLCQRYYQSGYTNFFMVTAVSGYGYYGHTTLTVTMRANPAVNLTSVFTDNFTATSGPVTVQNNASFYEFRSATASAKGGFQSTYTADAEL